MNTDTVNDRTYHILEESKPYFLGRWFEKEIDGVPHMLTTTDGAQVYFMTEGCTSFDLHFTDITHIRTPYFAYSIDGSEPVRQLITDQTVRLPDADRHAVCIIADGMAEGEGKWYEEIGFALKAVIPAEGGRLWGIKPTAPLVFFYGDSITEGIRSVSMAPDSDGNSATHAYPWYCARSLDVIPYFIGYGATGMIRTGWFNTMAKAIDGLSWQHTVADSPAANRMPDLIVINHGTNDMDFSMLEYMNAMNATMSLLYRRYPDIPVVYVIPLQQTHATIIRRIMSEYPNGYVIESDGWPVTFTDGVHPNAAGAKIMGELVADGIRSLGVLRK